MAWKEIVSRLKMIGRRPQVDGIVPFEESRWDSHDWHKAQWGSSGARPAKVNPPGLDLNPNLHPP